MTLYEVYKEKYIPKPDELKVGELYKYAPNSGAEYLALYLKESFCDVTYAKVHTFDIRGTQMIFGKSEIGRYFEFTDST